MAQTFVYKARDKMGKVHTGQMEADSREAVIGRLRQNGYIVTMLEARENARAPGTDAHRGTPVLRGKVTSKDLALMCRQFATMIGAGLPLMRALAVLAEQTSRRRLREALEDVRSGVEGGSSLSAALQKHGKVFPPLIPAMVRAGETGGILDEALNRLAEHFEDEYELKEKIKNASTYPLIVCGIAVIVIMVMMTFVLPTFRNMLATLGVDLPLPTKILIAVSTFMKEYILLIVAAVAVAVFGAARYISSPQGRRNYDRIMITKVPVIRDIVLKVSVARVCRTIGTLVQSGVPLMQAIEVSEAVAGNAVIVEALARAREGIREGAGLARTLAGTGVFSPMVTQMIAVGEETGTLDIMLKKVAAYYEREVKDAVSGLSSAVEPVLVVFLGVVVGSMIISILLPLLRIYDAAGKY